MPNAFLSYCLRDLALVEPLVIQLGMLGYDVQFERKMPKAQIRWPHVLDSIQNADLFVLAVTPASIHSYSRGIEVRYAQALGKPILRLLMDDVYENIQPFFMPMMDYRQPNASANDDLANMLESLSQQPPAEPEADNRRPDWLSPLRKLRTIITSQRINPTNQGVVLLNLSEMFERQETYHAAEALLELFAARTDLEPEFRIGVQEIVASIKDSSQSQRRARWLNAAVGGVILTVFMAALILFLNRSQSNRQANQPPLVEQSVIVPVENSAIIAAGSAQEPTEPSEASTTTGSPTETPDEAATSTLTFTPTNAVTSTPQPPDASSTATLLPLVIVTSTTVPGNNATRPLPISTTVPGATFTRTPTQAATSLPPTLTFTPTLDLAQIFGTDIYIGMIVTDTPQGVRVTAVGPTAATTGVRVGDYVVAVDLEPINSAAEFQQEMNARNPFARVDIRMRRGNLYSAIMTLGFADYMIPTVTTGAPNGVPEVATSTVSAPVAVQ